MIRLFTVHPTAANILMLTFIVLGLAAVPSLRRDTFPLVPATDVEVRIAYSGATPAEVEAGICREIEDPIRAVDNLAELSCLARDGMAIITAEIVEGADMSRFSADVKAAVDGVTSYPDKAEDPVVRVVERVATVASVAIAGPKDPAVLLAYADSFAERLRADPAISQVSVGGFSDREISVGVPAVALQRFGLTIGDVAAALARQSIDMPAGTMEGPQGDTSIRFLGERRTPAELASIPVSGTTGGGEVLLGDIATITTAFSDASQASYFNGERAAIVTVSKTETQDALMVMAALERQMAAAQAQAPGNVTLAISQDFDKQHP